MSVLEWGAVGELISGVAVLITLAYLALQIRQNTRAMRVGSLQARHDAINQIYRDMYQTPGMPELLGKEINDPESLTEVEDRSLSLRLISYLTTLQGLYYERKLGTLEEELTRSVDQVVQLARSPRRRRWWREQGRNVVSFSPEFIAHVDSVVDRFEEEEGET
jgi:hypothetical protein